MLIWILCSITLSGLLTPITGSIQKRVGLLVLWNLFFLLPMANGWPVTFYIVGWFGSFSMSLLVWSVARHIPVMTLPNNGWLLPLMLVGWWLILAQFIAGMPSLYDLGYLPKALVFVLLLVGTLAWFQRQQVVWLVLWLAIPAWWWQLFASQNLWDYILDPWLTLGLSVTLIRDGVRYYSGKSKSVSG